MLEAEFNRQIQAIIQQPDNKTTRRFYWSCQKLGPGTEAEMLTALAFIARNFSSQTAQGAYEVIRFGSGALPEEMISSAVYLQAGHTPEQVSRMAHDGRLPIFDPSSTHPRLWTSGVPWPSAGSRRTARQPCPTHSGSDILTRRRHTAVPGLMSRNITAPYWMPCGISPRIWLWLQAAGGASRFLPAGTRSYSMRWTHALDSAPPSPPGSPSMQIRMRSR